MMFYHVIWISLIFKSLIYCSDESNDVLFRKGQVNGEVKGVVCPASMKCQGKVGEQTISSKHYGYGNYDNNEDECWQILAEDAKGFEIHFDDPFELEDHGTCTSDYLEIVDLSGKHRICGENAIPETVNMNGSSICITFHSDSCKTYKGFRINVKPTGQPVDQSPPCGLTKFKEGGNKIMGGSRAGATAWPWQISIQEMKGHFRYQHFCGGTLINERWVLTASHCVYRRGREIHVRYLKVMAGNTYLKNKRSRSTQERYVQKIIVFPPRSGKVPQNDIALLLLRKPLLYSGSVQPVCLPREESEVGQSCVTTGWGRTKYISSSPILNQVTLGIADTPTCESSYQSSFIPENMICAQGRKGRRGTCQGDSGGPLVCRKEGNERYILHGITSWGRSDCGRSPSIFTKVSSFTAWIKTQVSSMDKNAELFLL